MKLNHWMIFNWGLELISFRTTSPWDVGCNMNDIQEFVTARISFGRNKSGIWSVATQSTFQQHNCIHLIATLHCKCYIHVVVVTFSRVDKFENARYSCRCWWISVDGKLTVSWKHWHHNGFRNVHISSPCISGSEINFFWVFFSVAIWKNVVAITFFLRSEIQTKLFGCQFFF